jgi:2-polyprenyl-3-methyl-5-hydroxy-6-metoxy-1,4-benzoquinol methylase
MDSDQLIKEMNAYYSRRAPWHDGCLNYTDNRAMEKLLGPIIGRIEKYISGRDVLEIACGTGNWTQVLSRRARNVVATDVNDSVLDIARGKPYLKENVRFMTADAYDLTSVEGEYNAAFAADWFSHIPKSKVESFLEGLHDRLTVGSNVIFVDMMPGEYDFTGEIFFDREGNRIKRRILPDGSRFNVVKNFPTENELRELLESRVTGMIFLEDLPLRRWLLAYTIK